MATMRGRMSHLSAVIGETMIMIGGYHKDQNDKKDTTVDMSHIFIYSLSTGTWSKVVATGKIPRRGSGMCSTVCDRKIYVFGGLVLNETSRHPTMREFSNDLYELNTETMVWRLLGPTDNSSIQDGDFDIPSRPTVRDKATMVYHGNSLWIFAGWGSRILRATPNSTFVPDQTHAFVGWNNEMWRFDLGSESWSAPPCSGTIPSPRAAHTLTVYSDNQAVLFGGRTRTGRVSELYIFNFDTTTWTGPFSSENGPQPRSLHTCTRLHDNSVLLLGGMDKAGNSVNLQWKLKTATSVPTWEQVKLCPAANCGRTWHTTAVHTTSSCSEILVFGGSPDNIWEPDHAYWANMIRFFYGVRPLYDMCLDTISETSGVSEYPLIHLDIESRRKLITVRKVGDVFGAPSVSYKHDVMLPK